MAVAVDTNTEIEIDINSDTHMDLGMSMCVSVYMCVCVYVCLCICVSVYACVRARDNPLSQKFHSTLADVRLDLERLAGVWRSGCEKGLGAIASVKTKSDISRQGADPP
jgi:hypothetical protein